MLGQTATESPIARPTRSVSRRRLSSRAGEYLFILPATGLLVLTVLFPIATAIYLSFNAVKLVPPQSAFMGFATTFVGFDNYLEALSDGDFWNAFRNTTVFTIITVIGSLVLGLGMALLLDASIRARSLWRILLLSPWVISSVVAGSTWRWMFEARYGVFNGIIRMFDESLAGVLWLADPNIAIISVSIASTWLRTPFMIIMLVAGLQAIPAEQYEAASVDGASAWTRFRYITLPNLQYVLMVATLLETIWTFKQFDLIQVMTGGGPGRVTEVLSTQIYKMSFEFFRFGPASATGMIMTFVLAIFAFVYVRLLQSRD